MSAGSARPTGKILHIFPDAHCALARSRDRATATVTYGDRDTVTWMLLREEEYRLVILLCISGNAQQNNNYYQTK